MFVFKGNFCPRFTQYCLIWVVLLVLWLAPNMMVMTYGQQSGNTQAKSKFTNSDAPTLVPENPFDRSSTPATLNPNKISTTDACSQTPIVGQNKVYSAIGLKITCQESKTGNLVWTQTLKSDFVNSGLLLVSEIDKIFANCNNDSLYCFDSENGQILWKIPTGGNCSQMTYKQGGLYFTCCGDASLYAIDAKSGQQKWNVTQPAQAPLNQVITSLPTESKQNNTIQPTTTIAANTNKTTATTTPTAAVTPPKAVSQPAVSKPAKKLLLGGEFDWDAMTLTASADIDHLNEDLIYANYIEQHSLAQAPLFEGYSRQNTHGLQLYPTNIYAQRLAVLPTVIPMEYNEYVKYFIDLYVGSKRDQVSRMLGRASHYFPMVEEVLARHGLPIELKCIPVIESAMSPNARSENGRMACTTLWFRNKLVC
ncbi:MAG TPA: PQQ-binding-like beta-propeller repeat protein [Chitinophagales bacterium]|nr:PQQ-binding-like beta-propeller repeat protein [Chitinophagales bacterium]